MNRGGSWSSEFSQFLVRFRSCHMETMHANANKYYVYLKGPHCRVKVSRICWCHEMKIPPNAENDADLYIFLAGTFFAPTARRAGEHEHCPAPYAGTPTQAARQDSKLAQVVSRPFSFNPQTRKVSTNGAHGTSDREHRGHPRHRRANMWSCACMQRVEGLIMWY